jgi:excisionase family DNA binding protein
VDKPPAIPIAAKARTIPDGIVSISEQDDRFQSVKESAAFSSLRVRKLNYEIRAGRLRAYRIGHKTLIKRSDLIAYIEQHEITLSAKSEPARSGLNELLTRCIDRARKNVGDREKRREPNLKAIRGLRTR